MDKFLSCAVFVALLSVNLEFVFIDSIEPFRIPKNFEIAGVLKLFQNADALVPDFALFCASIAFAFVSTFF
jgi:hypothetical protein